MSTPEITDARTHLEQAWEDNRLDEMESAARFLVDNNDWQMLHRLVQELVGLAEGNLCEPSCEYCNAPGSGLHPGDPTVGRLAANFARILADAVRPIPCPDCRRGRCRRCYGLGQIAGDCPNPILLYLRGLRVWWPRGWWGWLRHTRSRDPLALLTFAEAHKRLPGLELLDMTHLSETHAAERFGYLTPPMIPTSAGPGTGRHTPIRTAERIRLLGPVCPELPEVPPCFCTAEGDCPVCQGESAQTLEEHHASYSSRSLCHVCEGGTFCVRCDPRSQLRAEEQSQDGYLQTTWMTRPGNREQPLRTRNRRRRARQARESAPNVSASPEVATLLRQVSRQLETLSRSMGQLGQVIEEEPEAP